MINGILTIAWNTWGDRVSVWESGHSEICQFHEFAYKFIVSGDGSKVL